MNLLQILALALVYALIIKTPEEDVDEVSRELVSLGLAPAHDSLTLDDLNDPNKLSELHKRKRAAPPPPEQGHLAELREKKRKEKEMQQLVRKGRCYFDIVHEDDGVEHSIIFQGWSSTSTRRRNLFRV